MKNLKEFVRLAVLSVIGYFDFIVEKKDPISNIQLDIFRFLVIIKMPIVSPIIETWKYLANVSTPKFKI